MCFINQYSGESLMKILKETIDKNNYAAAIMYASEV